MSVLFSVKLCPPSDYNFTVRQQLQTGVVYRRREKMFSPGNYHNPGHNKRLINSQAIVKKRLFVTREELRKKSSKKLFRQQEKKHCFSRCYAKTLICRSQGLRIIHEAGDFTIDNRQCSLTEADKWPRSQTNLPRASR